MYVCMYVCMHASMYVCIHTYRQIYRSISTHAYKCRDRYPHTPTHAEIDIHTHTYTYTRISIGRVARGHGWVMCASALTRVTLVNTFMCTRTRMRIDASTRPHVRYVRACVHACMYRSASRTPKQSRQRECRDRASSTQAQTLTASAAPSPQAFS